MGYNWEGKEEICYRMYIEERRPLDQIMEYLRAEFNFAPSKRAFQTQFKRWDFPSKQSPAHLNEPLVARVHELWERNASQKEMLRVLRADGFDINERELMRVRAKNRWLLRVPNGLKSADEGGSSRRATSAAASVAAAASDPTSAAGTTTAVSDDDSPAAVSAAAAAAVAAAAAAAAAVAAAAGFADFERAFLGQQPDATNVGDAGGGGGVEIANRRAGGARGRARGGPAASMTAALAPLPTTRTSTTATTTVAMAAEAAVPDVHLSQHQSTSSLSPSSPDPSPELLAQRQQRRAQLQQESAERWATRKRRRRTRGWAGLPADPPGPPRFPSETTIDESRAILGLDSSLYRQLRDAFQLICQEGGFVKKTIAGPERWQAAKDRLVRENAHLQAVFQSSSGEDVRGSAINSRDHEARDGGIVSPAQPQPPRLQEAGHRPEEQTGGGGEGTRGGVRGGGRGGGQDAKALALDVLCCDVTKRMRTVDSRMTLAEAKNTLGINPVQSRALRTAFYQALKAGHFSSKLEAGEEHWRALKAQWIRGSPLLTGILAEPGPDAPAEAAAAHARRLRAVEVLCCDVMKRLRDDEAKRKPSKRPREESAATAATAIAAACAPDTTRGSVIPAPVGIPQLPPPQPVVAGGSGTAYGAGEVDADGDEMDDDSLSSGANSPMLMDHDDQSAAAAAAAFDAVGNGNGQVVIPPAPHYAHHPQHPQHPPQPHLHHYATTQLREGRLSHPYRITVSAATAGPSPPPPPDPYHLRSSHAPLPGHASSLGPRPPNGMVEHQSNFQIDPSLLLAAANDPSVVMDQPHTHGHRQLQHQRQHQHQQHQHQHPIHTPSPPSFATPAAFTHQRNGASSAAASIYIPPPPPPLPPPMPSSAARAPPAQPPAASAPAAIPVYFRLSPASRLSNSGSSNSSSSVKKVWLATLRSTSVQELRRLALASSSSTTTATTFSPAAPNASTATANDGNINNSGSSRSDNTGLIVARIDGIVRDVNNNSNHPSSSSNGSNNNHAAGAAAAAELCFPIDEDDELEAYLAHIAGGKATFSVQLMPA